MENIMNKAYTEVFDIINHMEKELYTKIPKSMILFLKNNMDKEYKVNIDYSKSINEQSLIKETRVLLAIIYRDYLCSLEKKQELILRDKKELIRLEEEKREKYNPDNLFKNPKVVSEQNQHKEIIAYKESIFKKIINKLKRIFRK